jgi:hypothetical protein
MTAQLLIKTNKPGVEPTIVQNGKSRGSRVATS